MSPTTSGEIPRSTGTARESRRGHTLVDQLALAVPAALAVGVFVLGAADVISNRAAYTIVIVASLTTLFALGVLMSVHHQKGRASSIALGERRSPR